MGRLTADEVYRLTESLVAIPSISPDVDAETRCARAIAAALPAEAMSGTWSTPDGRPIVWARATGRPGPAVLMLAHYDTVGTREYGDRNAFDSTSLRECFADEPAHDERFVRDLELERREPGTWMFGRGALDMKSGVAAGIAALHACHDEPPVVGDVVFVATPDEEHESAGILAALPELARMKVEDDVRFVGALNLDFGEGPVAYAGVEGKLLLGILAVGAPTHAGAPLEGTDAINLAASVVTPMTLETDAVGPLGHIPVALALRDLKTHYDVQTAAEAYALMHVPLPDTRVEATFDAMRAHARQAAEGWLERLGQQRVQAVRQGARRSGMQPEGVAVLSIADLGGPGNGTPDRADDMQRLALDAARAAARSSDVPAPYVMLYASPPFYPASSRCDGPVGAATREVCEVEGHEVRALYPFVSDACYLRWDENTEWLTRHMPGFGGAYALPVDAMRALDLDVVNLGPWGRDAHGLHERVHAPYAFGTLPGLIERTARRALELA